MVGQNGGLSHDCALARWSCTSATVPVRAHGPAPRKVCSTFLAAPAVPPRREKVRDRASSHHLRAEFNSPLPRPHNALPIFDLDARKLYIELVGLQKIQFQAPAGSYFNRDEAAGAMRL